jgi:hypothetical protein
MTESALALEATFQEYVGDEAHHDRCRIDVARHGAVRA